MKLSDMKPGDKIAGFKDFGCLPDGAEREVKSAPYATKTCALYVNCREGKHFLDGQVDDDGELVGLFIATPEAMRAYRRLLKETGGREEYPDHGPTDPWQTSGPGSKS